LVFRAEEVVKVLTALDEEVEAGVLLPLALLMLGV
jgi:hypothetical protein